MKVQKRKLMRIFLVPLLLVVLFQGIMPFFMLMASGVKDTMESKICTLIVVEKYRKQHVATQLLERTFKYLGTTKPLITIADYKFPMFEHIIKKYWKLMQTMRKGYYNSFSRELVYNGKLPE